MHTRWLLNASLAAFSTCFRAAAQDADGPLCGQPPADDAIYKNPQAGTSDRVDNLLSHMCWNEKIAQLGGIGGLLEGNNSYNENTWLERNRLHNGTISPGSYLNNAKDAAVVLSELIQRAKKDHRLGIPMLQIADAVNGPTLRGTTLFPATLSIGQSWNLPLYTEVVSTIRDELAVIGINWVLSPEVDVAWDPRNGRVGEMYGEDPYMNGEFAAAYIAKVQEKNDDGYMTLAATIKHWVYGTSVGGVNQASMFGGANHIYNILALPYINVFRKVKPATVMPSYSTIDGIPAHSSKYLLQKILREQLGFEGVIVSDADAIPMLYATHYTAADRNDAAIKSLAAGVEIELAVGFPTAFESLVGNRTSPEISRDVNSAVSRLLALKFTLGLFDRSLAVNETKLTRTLLSERHTEINRQVSRESVVLLKNDENALPLSGTPQVAVVGPFADVINTGTYAAWTNAENGNLTFLDAVRKRLGAENVFHSKGVDFVDETGGDIASAVAAAHGADVAIVTLGSIAVGYEDSLFSKRTDGEGNTHASLAFPGRQNELLQAIIDTGKPVILVVSGGQAFELAGAAQNAKAIIHSFLGGEYTGQAIAEILTGEVNPSGRLTISFPVRSEVNPSYYNHQKSDWQQAGAIQFPFLEERYRYPFGYGLSYTTFEWSNVTLDRQSYGKAENITVSVTVRNSGAIDGQEVVQVYFRQRFAAVSLPTKRLTGFSKVTLPAGDSKVVEIAIPVDYLGYWNEGEYQVDDGTYEFYVGKDSSTAALGDPIVIQVV